MDCVEILRFSVQRKGLAADDARQSTPTSKIIDSDDQLTDSKLSTICSTSSLSYHSSSHTSHYARTARLEAGLEAASAAPPPPIEPGYDRDLLEHKTAASRADAERSQRRDRGF